MSTNGGTDDEPEHDDEWLGLSARVSTLEQSNRSRLDAEMELLAKVRELHASRRDDRNLYATEFVNIHEKLDRLLLMVPTLARRKRKKT